MRLSNFRPKLVRLRLKVCVILAKILTLVRYGYVFQGRYRPGELDELPQNELNSGGETRMVS